MNATLMLNVLGQAPLHSGTFRASSGAALAKAALAFYPTDDDIPLPPAGKIYVPRRKTFSRQGP
jgi:hypothetical protein